MEWITDPQGWIALGTLTVLEIVLGIDNIIFISILAGRLPQADQKRARLIGLALAMLTRVALLFSLTWMMRLTAGPTAAMRPPVFRKPSWMFWSIKRFPWRRSWGSIKYW